MTPPCRTKKGKFTSCKKLSKKKKSSRKSNGKKSMYRLTPISTSPHAWKLVSGKKPKKSSRSEKKSKKDKSSRRKGRPMSTSPRALKLTGKRTKSSSRGSRKSVKIPRAPRAPAGPGGIIRPGYYGRVSRPPPVGLPSQMPKELCWTNKNQEECTKRPVCRWDSKNSNCYSVKKGGRAAALKLGGPTSGLPLSVCGTQPQSTCDFTYGCQWSQKGKVCIPRKD